MYDPQLYEHNVQVLLNYILQHGEVKNIDTAYKGLITAAKMKNRNCILYTQDIQDLFINTTNEFYFENARSINDFVESKKEDINESNKNPILKLVKLSTDYNIFEDNIYIGYKYNIYNKYWQGAYVGTKDFLFNRFFNVLFDFKEHTKINENHTSENVSLENFVKEIYNNLMLKETWEENNFKKLKNYITSLANAALSKLKNKTLSDIYYKKWNYNSTEYILLNSKLLDKFGNWIYILYKVRKKYDRDNNRVSFDLFEPIMINSSRQLITYGLQINLKDVQPIQFYEKKEDLIFEGNIEEFDLEDTIILSHMLEDRADRLPESLQKRSPFEQSSIIKSSIEYAVNISKFNYNFIIPCFFITEDKMQYLVPIFEKVGIDEKACNAIIVNKVNEIYILNTILTIEDAYNMARLISIPSATWL
jgi:hypothetical protein